MEGYTINKNRIAKHYQEFQRAVEDLKSLIPAGDEFKTTDAVELIQSFAHTWFSLDAYDRQSFTEKGFPQSEIGFTSDERGAFSFIWFLKKAEILRPSLTPEALTTLTLLVAESKPEDKNKLVGLILLILRKDKVMRSVNS